MIVLQNLSPNFNWSGNNLAVKRTRKEQDNKYKTRMAKNKIGEELDEKNMVKLPKILIDGEKKVGDIIRGPG